MTSTPKCTSKRHKWQAYGGCKENPGYYGIGGSAISYQERCLNCDMWRNKVFGDVDTYGNKNHGWEYHALDVRDD